MSIRLAVGGVVVFFCSAVAGAQVIDFETLPGGSSTDNLAISNQYQASFGVSFALDTNLDGLPDAALPIMEASGGLDPTSGFFNQTSGLDDTAEATFTSQLANFFLRGDAAGAPVNLVITYNSPVSSAGGEIWDIDGASQASERWQVKALSGIGVGSTLVTGALSPNGIDSTLDGKPWAFTLNAPTGLTFDHIVLQFSGTKTSGIGLAFDNFTPLLPEPASIGLLALCAGAMTRRRGRAGSRGT
ncbi:MAG: hypothetical protein H7144_04360 [Burkholderiales bacterium]|nr:hypothetical protein [Phycisphaerae bacterium]